MIHLASPSKLRERGILGMNRRNIGYIGANNPRRNYPLVDNKLLTKKMALQQNIPVPELYGTIERQQQVAHIVEIVAPYPGFVIKPAQGSGGKGILVITGREDDQYIKSTGERIDGSELRRHGSNILAGMHSLGGRNDKVMIEALIDFDSELKQYSYEGVPDIRVVAFMGVPVMAMLRCATHSSDGKANLHQGAVGVGIDIATGASVCAVQKEVIISHHPDTGAAFEELRIPHWDTVLDLAARCVEMTGLEYLGADVVLDRQRGPILLELNARPGLAIQLANQCGLCHRLEVAREIAASTEDHDTRIKMAKQRFAVGSLVS